jgi:nitrate reductase assembly molybdenum cofactor insertion protein NarJ
MALNDEQVRALLLATRETRDVEIDCDELLAQLPAYVEQRSAVPAAERGGFTEVEAHLRLCRNCREEWQALVSAIDDIT